MSKPLPSALSALGTLMILTALLGSSALTSMLTPTVKLGMTSNTPPSFLTVLLVSLILMFWYLIASFFGVYDFFRFWSFCFCDRLFAARQKPAVFTTMIEFAF
jgi:hypothetical protein